MANSADIGVILKKRQVKQVQAIDPTDTWLKTRVSHGCESAGIEIEWLEDPAFLTPVDVIQRWAEGRQHYHFTDFYVQQRKRLGVLLDAKGKPWGGKWTYDTENRKKLPKDIVVPEVASPVERASIHEAKKYVAKRFPKAIGEMKVFIYPVTYDDARVWLNEFVESRLSAFGDYEDAISQNETFVFHGVLTPMLNIGLLTPKQIIEAVLEKCDEVSLNSLEGFLRQVIGWREFIRLVYLQAGSRQRTRNAWGLSRKLPAAFYDGTTGIVPFDRSIQRTLKYAYCHHIERLMVLGNFMLLCDIAPNPVYQWFMEMFIDSYDWVMVPNVYGMSQYADDGLMTTKPYISGSSYICKMSDYTKGPWCEIWDALYWRFVDRERKFFSENPRMRVMVGQLDRMGSKLDRHRAVAERFLEKLHG
jgi:deoxyribodipyrimidine photolyase-related protein